MKTVQNIEHLIRPNIRSLTPYSTARDEYKGPLGICLDANENPYENGFNRYPDPHQKALKKRISEIKGVSPDVVFIGNGSDEAIDLIFRVFCTPGVDNVVSIAPTYGMYKVAASINDVAFREVLLNDDFSLDEEALFAATDDRTKLLWLCSPNNPSGNAFSREQLVRIIQRFPGMVVLDEAYIDFASGPGLLPELEKYANLIILQTLSKAWGMAGLRLGLAFAAPCVVKAFSQVKYPYNINCVAQKWALAQLERPIDRQIAELKVQKERVIKELSRSDTIRKIFPSDANFVLVRVEEPQKVYQALINAGIIVRDRSQMPRCEGCLRITIGTPAENDRLIAAITNDPCGARTTTIHRQTNETDIAVTLDLDGNYGSRVSTGIGFFDHMLMQLPHHAGVMLIIEANGDLHVDEHHTVEDVGITLGEAFRKALGDKRGIERYGFVLPMDESRAMALLDFGGRAALEWEVDFRREKIGEMPTELFKHFFKSFSDAAQCNLHIVARGENEHHKIEGVFKAFARAIKMAIVQSPFSYSLPSSKGVL